MLSGKVALVTGAGQGIGQSIALSLGEKGASIVVADIDLQAAEKTVAELRSRNHEAVAVKVSVSVPNEVENLVAAALRKFESIDILVNNAGIHLIVPTTEMTEEQWDAILSVNLKGVFLCSRAVAKEMIKQGGGRIINIASPAAHQGVPETAAYCASKGGVVALTRAVAVEWAKYNIIVNSISPGMTATPLVQRLIRRSPKFELQSRRGLLGRIATVNDVANLVVFLASEESSFIVGQNIVIDGGLSAINPGFIEG